MIGVGSVGLVLIIQTVPTIISRNAPTYINNPIHKELDDTGKETEHNVSCKIFTNVSNIFNHLLVFIEIILPRQSHSLL